MGKKRLNLLSLLGGSEQDKTPVWTESESVVSVTVGATGASAWFDEQGNIYTGVQPMPMFDNGDAFAEMQRDRLEAERIALDLITKKRNKLFRGG